MLSARTDLAVLEIDVPYFAAAQGGAGHWKGAASGAAGGCMAL